MLPVHTILHPTDFSERSTHALQLACSLARDHGARVVVLHVLAPPAVAYGEALTSYAEEAERRAAEEKLNRLQLPDPAISLERRLTEGEPAERILQVAEEIHADLIVMGTHGRTGLSRLLMGSVAEQVVRQAPCPVLTIKAPFPGESTR